MYNAGIFFLQVYAYVVYKTSSSSFSDFSYSDQGFLIIKISTGTDLSTH